MDEIPLGKSTEYPTVYTPELLFPVPRQDARTRLGISADLPFRGCDIWNAWELSWLDPSGKPHIGTATFVVDANSDNIIESKSLKLYLNSFSMTRIASATDIEETIAADLSAVAGTNVDVTVHSDSNAHPIAKLTGHCVDDINLKHISESVDAEILQCDRTQIVSETLYSHLLRSNCPVTHQPDIGSIAIEYDGAKLDRAALLQYIVSYRQHSDFHEACVERVFLDIQKQCNPKSLSVYARFNRRGGLDINPYRTNTNRAPQNSRLWRQ